MDLSMRLGTNPKWFQANLETEGISKGISRKTYHLSKEKTSWSRDFLRVFQVKRSFHETRCEYQVISGKRRGRGNFQGYFKEKNVLPIEREKRSGSRDFLVKKGVLWDNRRSFHETCLEFQVISGKGTGQGIFQGFLKVKMEFYWTMDGFFMKQGT